MRCGLDINSKDRRESTPLHWAAFAGAELALSYIVAWNPNIDARDSKGLTPLHLAVIASEDLRSTKSIKQLLIKGADIYVTDALGRRPIDLLKDFRSSSHSLIIEISKLLVSQFPLYSIFYRMIKSVLSGIA